MYNVYVYEYMCDAGADMIIFELQSRCICAVVGVAGQVMCDLCVVCRYICVFVPLYVCRSGYVCMCAGRYTYLLSSGDT